MSLLVLAVWNTEENKRIDYTKQTLYSLLDTVDFNKHRLFLSDNGSYEPTINLYKQFSKEFSKRYNSSNLTIHFNGENLGTARAVNKGIKTRLPGENVTKCDDDVVVHTAGWLDEMEFAIKLEPKIGLIGLKRNDIEQHQRHENKLFKTQLYALPHKAGERWCNIEVSRDVMGTCTMFSSAALDVLGLMVQPKFYGFDDALMCIRILKAGFLNCFLPHIPISHIDTGSNGEYIKWKQGAANESWEEFQRMANGFADGSIDIKVSDEN